jgi:DNA polymerase elongation subunit (family B)
LTLKFVNHIKKKIGNYYGNSIIESKLINRKKLYGFNAGKEYKFILLKFKNTMAMNKAKKLWYIVSKDPDKPDWNKYKLLKDGYQEFDDQELKQYKTFIYEANIPPLLRLFHMKKISPSGWVTIPIKNIIKEKNTSCTYEFQCSFKDIIPLNNKDTSVPYKIMSFDIEADSSHGDFPLAVKKYKKLATNIIDYLENCDNKDKQNEQQITQLLYEIIATAFGYGDLPNIDIIYTKKTKPDYKTINNLITEWIKLPIKDFDIDDEELQELNKEAQASSYAEQKEDEQDVTHLDEEEWVKTNELNSNIKIKKSVRKGNIIDMLMNNRIKRDIKINEINMTLSSKFPKVAGDKVTFIGSTFLTYGETKPYLNNCLVLNTCSHLPNVENQELDYFTNEKDLLAAWTKLVQREDPDIVIGYNIWGFDWSYMFNRAIETGCVDDFIKLSRNNNENSVQKHWKTKKLTLKESVLNIASGTHELKYVEMNGRLQIDLYNVFRRDHNLISYKLDYVSGHFIGDIVKELHHNNNTTIIKSDNLSGLDVGSWIHFEEISYSSDYYKDGDKFQVIEKSNKSFTIQGRETPNMSKKVRWCLAKDDVTPQDIFNLARQGPDERAIVAKYCIQDCNLVHELMLKLDIITGFVEMAKLCTVPMSFLVLRGQGIKLTSYIAKKCREKKFLIPCIDKDESEDGYEGAIVLEPKCDLYFEDPVACVDYSSLYPSSMISDNLCHSSKVSTKVYDLDNNLLFDTGEKDNEGYYKYDNLPDYTYVDVKYDTYVYERKTPKGAAQKVKTGYKICRFAEHKDGKAVMPSVLQELLASRKETKKLCKNETDPFMKNVYDKRQLSIKLTANSLYGQCGAKTSYFYEPDVAASCTAVGRKLLTLAKTEIEREYGDKICDTTKYGPVKTNAQYIYGDTDSVFFCFYLQELDGTPIKNTKALEITIELAQKAGKFVTKQLKEPHDLEYEKTFLPFCLLSKKRYVGMLFEHDINKGKRKEMGIVLKRRDNAPIVKDVYGGVIDILMKDKSVVKAIEFTENMLQKLVNGDIPIEKLIVTKSLRSNYKNPKQIAHKVLSERMAVRDPGNKPRSGDRIPYAYIVNPDKKALQGDRIETPDFIRLNNLSIDYEHYITNQIMKPLLQLFALVIEDIPEFNVDVGIKTHSIVVANKISAAKIQLKDNPLKLSAKIEEIKEKTVKNMIFEKYIKKK